MTTTSLQENLSRAAHDPAYFAKLMLGEDAVLYKHQIDAIRQMGPVLYDSPNTAMMAPIQSGITTIMLYMALWHGLFAPGKTALFLLKDSKTVTEFKVKLDELVKQVRWVTGAMFTHHGELPGIIVVKTSTIVNIKAQKGTDTTAIYIDTPPASQDVDFIKKLSVVAMSLKTRFHIMSSGYHPAVAAIVKTGKLGDMQFVGTHVLARQMYNDSVLDQIYTRLGEAEFLSQILCADPRDPNAMARFIVEARTEFAG